MNIPTDRLSSSPTNHTKDNHTKGNPNHRTDLTAGAQLLDRPALPTYRAQQTKQISQPLPMNHKRNESTEQLSVLVFRLGQEWLALPAHLCQQILSPLPCHTLPHRSNRTLLGIVNVRGQLLLKVCLKETLGLNTPHVTAVKKPAETASVKAYSRMVVLEKPVENHRADIWAFDVDEMYGVHSISKRELEPAAGAALVGETCVRNVFAWCEQRVSVLDDDRLFDALKRRSL